MKHYQSLIDLPRLRHYQSTLTKDETKSSQHPKNHLWDSFEKPGELLTNNSRNIKKPIVHGVLRNKVSQTNYCSKVYKFSFCLLFYIPNVCLHVSRAMSHFPSKVQRNEGWLKTFTELYFLLTSVFGFIKQIAGFKRTTLRKRWHKLQILTGSDLATTFKPQNSEVTIQKIC